MGTRAKPSGRQRRMGIYDEKVKERCAREFFTPEPISRTGNYYPRYRTTGLTEWTGFSRAGGRHIIQSGRVSALLVHTQDDNYELLSGVVCLLPLFDAVV